MLHARPGRQLTDLRGWLGRWLLRNTATSCTVEICFKSRSDGKEVGIPGRWSVTPQPLAPDPGGGSRYDPQAVPMTLRLDLLADRVGQTVAIAIKSDGDQSAYGFTSDSYQVPDFRLPAYELPDEEYDVLVRASSGGIEAHTAFTLINSGTSSRGLKFGVPA
jgi:hypothetical protein